MYKIVFTKSAAESDEAVAKLVGEAVYGPGFRSPYIPSDRKWNLAGQNNWWIHFDGNTGTITNRGGQTRERMDEVVANLREQASLTDVTLEAI